MATNNDVIESSVSSPQTIATAASTVTTTQMGEFNPEIDQWLLYHERMENYFNACGVTDADRKKVLLLNFMGSKSYKLVRDLCTPQAPSTKQYNELCDMLNSFYTPPIVVFKERKQFYAAARSVDESIVQFIARLKSLASSCDFGNQIESIILDKFVTSLDGRVFDRLCEEDTAQVTLLRASQLALKYDTEKNKHADINVMKAGKRNQPNSANKKQNFNNGIKDGGESSSKQRCKHCGYKTHQSEQCKFKMATCYKCSRVGHLASICKQKTINSVSNYSNSIKLNQDNSLANIFSIQSNIENSLYATVKINNISHKFMLDSGAGVSAIPFKIFNDKYSRFYNLEKSDLMLQAYSGHNIDIIGKFNAKVQFNDKCHNLKIIVVNSDGPSILGRDFLDKFNISFAGINSVNAPVSLEFLLKKYNSLFDNKLGKYKYKQVSLFIDDVVSPKFCKPRPLPSAFKVKVDEELIRMESMGVITPVETNDWGTPLVPILKSDGGIRLCADYKITINRHLKDDKHPIPRVEEIFNALQGGLTFSKLDLMSAYNQLELDENSRKLVAWSTHRGVYLVNRLPFGVKPATGIFQRELEKLLLGISGVVNFLDDIVVTGATHQEHLSNLNQVLQKLSDAGFQLKKDKCEFFKEEITFLGHVLNKNGLSKTDDRIDCILNKPDPTNITEVRAFVGLVNYYGKFIQNLSSKMYPLYQLLQKDVKFVWNKECKDSFEVIKQEIVKNVVLSHFNPKLPIVLTCDASNYGIGSILSHILPNGEEKPIAFCSRTLTKSEKNYSVIDKEALAIVFSCKKFYYYLVGNHFILKTDHKPLLRIFGENVGIPQMAASRIQRWACILSGFDYTIKYTKGEENNADCLSRLPLKDNSDTIVEKNYLNFICDQSFNVDFHAVKLQTAKDPILAKAYSAIQSGSFDSIKKDDDMKSFYNRRTELTSEQGVVMWGYRAVIPMNLRKSVLQSIHSSHLGIVKCKALARSFVWWPGIDSDIEKMIKSCSACLSVRPDPTKSVLIPWEIPKGVWSRIHIDYAGPVNNEYFFIITDAYSKWPEVFRTKDITSNFTVNKLREVFSRFGLPDTIVSDNGTQFTSQVFKDFVKLNNIRHKTSPPGHPATNGAAENSVKSFKNGLKAALAHGDTNIDVIIQRYLFDYRIATHCTTGEAPSKLMLGRKVKSRFDLIRPPSVDEKLYQNLCNQSENFKGRRCIVFDNNEKVSIRDYRNPNKKNWQFAFIKKKIGHLTYLCETPQGKLVRCHINQMQKCEDQPNMTVNHNDNKKFKISEKKVLDVRVNNRQNDVINSNISNDSDNDIYYDVENNDESEELNIGGLFSESKIEPVRIRPKRNIKAPIKLNL